MAKYLVTGGAGFIGSHLCEQLLAAGHSVRVIDDLSTGKRDNLPSGVDFLHGCISDVALVSNAFSDIDGCFHLAAIASVERSCQQWEATHRINLGASVTLLDCARSTQTPVVYASSAAVYGNNSHIPLREAEPIAPLSPYGADKAGMELHAAAAAASFNLSCTGLRFFNVYGPRQDPHSPYSGVISIFAQRLLEHKDIQIHGDGQQTRDFIYVADVVALLQCAMQKQQAGQSRVFNVCTGRQTSVLQLAQTLKQLTGSRGDITFGDGRNGDIRHSGGDPARSIAAFDYRAEIALSDGLRRLLDYPA